MNKYDRNMLYRLFTHYGQLCIISRLRVATLAHRVRAFIQVKPSLYHFMAPEVEEESREKKRTNWSRPTDEPST